jgi:Fe-S cluster assembly protein SufD
MTAATAPSLTNPLERYRTGLESLSARDPGTADVRRTAFERALALGIPTQRDESWKYTNLKRFEMRTFALASGSVASLDSLEAVIPNVGKRVVLIDGKSSTALSTVDQLAGVTVQSFADSLRADPSLLSIAGNTSTFDFLNSAFAAEGRVIDIAAGAALDALHVVHVWTNAATALMSHPRLLLRAQRGSAFTLIEHYVGLGDGEVFTNAATTLELAEGARGTHLRLQQEGTRTFHVGSLRASLSRDANLKIADIQLGGSIARLDLTAVLNGEGASVELDGLFFPDGTQHIDSHTHVDHVAPHTSSDENYRGIASGRGRGVFNGKVLVHAGAQKTSARQSNRNLLLSAQAEIDTKPELEIYASDVKCAHGATTGQLDRQALYYLQSRAISLEDARAILTQAFAESALSAIPIESVRQHIERAVRAKMSNSVSVHE